MQPVQIFTRFDFAPPCKQYPRNIRNVRRLFADRVLRSIDLLTDFIKRTCDGRIRTARAKVTVFIHRRLIHRFESTGCRENLCNFRDLRNRINAERSSQGASNPEVVSRKGESGLAVAASSELPPAVNYRASARNRRTIFRLS